MRVLGDLSIRAILGLVGGLMGALLLAMSGAILLDAVERMADAGRVSVASSTSRELFKTLLAIRLERGVLIGGLAGEGPLDHAGEVDIAAYRRDAEQGYAASVALLAHLDVREVAATVPQLRSLHVAVVAARADMDAALRQAKSARQPGAQDWPALEQSLLDAITATIDRLAASVTLVDPLIDHALAINRAAWQARLHSGLAVLRMQQAVAAGKPWAPSDVVAYSEERAKALQAWSLVTEAAARADASKTLVAQVARANEIISGNIAKVRTAFADRLAAGQTVDIPISELRRGDTEANGYIVDVALTALSEMVTRADAVIGSATRRLLAGGAMLLMSLLLVGGGMLTVDRRITRPLARLATAMQTLVAGNNEIHIPDTDYLGEVGAFARALEVFKQNGLKIAHMARHDPLTDLSNRAVFNEYLPVMIDRARANQTGFAVLCLDLDRFKEINDLFGHSVGDAALRATSGRLKEAAQDDFLARLGGDEFIVIMSEGHHPSDAAAVAERMQACLVDDVVVDGHSFHLGLSIGIAVFPDDGHDAMTLIGNADAALYRAKNEGRGAIRFFTAEMDQQLRERRALQHDLRSAIEHGELTLAYQPQSHIDGEITGFEALARWNHPKRGCVPPAQFIPIAEDGGLIVEIGEWVLREACREAASWPRPLQVAVNVSAVQFRRADLHTVIHAILLETGLAASRLELELTEGVLIENLSRAASTLRSLKALGVRIALDDFGTGHSSLSYLQSFPLDRIKIDRSFVSKLGQSEGPLAIVRAVIGLAHGLNLPVIAEGVETEAQLAVLAHEQCDGIQGFLIGKPCPIETYAGFVGRAAGAARAVVSAGDFPRFPTTLPAGRAGKSKFAGTA